MNNKRSLLPTIPPIQSDRSQRGEKRMQAMNLAELSEARKRMSQLKAQNRSVRQDEIERLATEIPGHE